MKRLVTCICILTFGTSCVQDVSSDQPVKSLPEAEVLTIFVTGNVLGELKPCGCSGGQLGGLDRRSAVFNSVPKEGRLIVDTGSIVKDFSEQDLIKFNIILQAFKLLDYDVVSLSEQDIETGINVDLLDGNGPGFHIISAHDSPGLDIPVKFTKSLPLNGRTAVVTVSAFDAKSAAIEQIGQLFSDAGPGLIRRESKNDTQRINVLILNYYDNAIIDFIAENMPVVDCVICPAESDEPVVIGNPDKRPLVFSVGRFGRYICRVQINVAAGSKNEPKLSFHAIPVKEHLKPENSLVELYKDYQQLVKESNLLEKYPRVPLPDDLEYSGSESCKLCHEDEYEKWSGKAHAGAFATLERAGSHFDPECVVCHVVGMKYERGFVTSEKTGYLKNVGCENCHGPGSEHIATGGVTELTEPKSGCTDCHTPEHSGEYAGNEGVFLKKIIHWREPKPIGNVK